MSEKKKTQTIRIKTDEEKSEIELLKEQYEKNLDTVLSIMTNIDKYRVWINEERVKLSSAQLKSKVLEEQISYLLAQ